MKQRMRRPPDRKEDYREYSLSTVKDRGGAALVDERCTERFRANLLNLLRRLLGLRPS